MAKRPGPRRARRPAPDAAWVFMLALLASVTLVALALGGPRLPGSPGRLTGPWAGRITVPALIVEAILAAALTVVVVRGRRAPTEPHPGMTGSAPPDRAMVVARRLRTVLRQVLIVALLAIPALLLLNTVHRFTPNPRARPLPTVAPISFGPPTSTPSPPAHTLHLNGRLLEDILIALALLAVIAAGAIAVTLRRPASPEPTRDEPVLPDQDDEEDLREAVVAGRTALAALDDARAAVIACYLAMERSLAEAGAEREAADTPAELLARAAATGLVRTGAASRLTTLFYEARYSSHPFGPADRDAAEQALAELHADLATGVLR
jgi:hypothetical protein